MLTLRCSCGETYHAEERHIGSSILCKNCGQIVTIASPVREYPVAPKVTRRMDDSRPLQSTVHEALSRFRSSRTAMIICATIVMLGIGLAVFTKMHVPKPQGSQIPASEASTPTDPTTHRDAAIAKEATPKPASDPGESRSVPTLKERSATEEEPEPLNPKRLRNGSSPFGPGTRLGNSILTVENGTDTDAFVRVIRFLNGEQLTRNFYIIAGKSFIAREVPPGDYVLRIAFGKDWNESARGFNYRRLFSETQHFEIREETSEDEDATRIRYSRMSITLHKVLNGNFESHPISEEEFWR
jgi:hypothetical protein